MQSSGYGLRESGSLDPGRSGEDGRSNHGRQTAISTDAHPATGGDDARYKDPEWLERMYWERDRSMADIAEEVGLSSSGVYYWMEKLGVERRDQERAASAAVSAVNRVPDRDVRADLRRVARELGSVPTRAEYDGHGAYHSETVRSRIGDGSWARALESVGV